MPGWHLVGGRLEGGTASPDSASGLAYSHTLHRMDSFAMIAIYLHEVTVCPLCIYFSFFREAYYKKLLEGVHNNP